MILSRHSLVSLALVAACSGAVANENGNDGGAVAGGAAGATVAAGGGGSIGTGGTTNANGGGVIATGGGGSTAGGSAAGAQPDAQPLDSPGSDAAAPDVSSADDAAAPSPICEAGTNTTCNENPDAAMAQGWCALYSACICYAPNVISPDTGKCHMPHVCFPGDDSSCNDDQPASAPEGTCQADSTCACNPGFEKNVNTGRCTTAFKRTLPPPCVTVDDCCVTYNTCVSALYLVGKSELAAMNAWFKKAEIYPPKMCPGCMTEPVILTCEAGFCVGTAGAFGGQPEGAHCGLGVPASSSALSVPRRPLSGGTDAGPVRTSWGCGG